MSEENDKPLEGKKIAILATDGFEQSELLEPRQAFEDAGAETEVVSLEEGKIRAWNMTKWGKTVSVDRAVADAQVEAYDALLLPGGVMNPDKLRMNAQAVQFVRAFFDADKPVAAICHGPVLLVEADVARGRRLTSYPAIKTDLINAGAHWVDEEEVTDGNLVTSRKPDDIPAFNRAAIELFSQQLESRRQHAGSMSE
jgi:protease I